MVLIGARLLWSIDMNEIFIAAQHDMLVSNDWWRAD